MKLSDEIKIIHPRSQSFGWLCWLYVLWFIPVIESIILPDSLGVNKTILLPVSFVVWSLIRGRLLIFIHSLPFFCLISPLGGSIFGAFLYSEVALLFLILLSLYLIVKNKDKKLFTLDKLLLVISIVVFLSYLNSFEYLSLWKGLLNATFFFCAYIATRASIKNYSGLIFLFVSIFIATFYSAIILINYYFYGINLNDAMGVISGISPSEFTFASNLGSMGSYFYTNIFYILGISLIIGPLIINKINGILLNTFIFLSYAFIVSATIINFNKTAFVALGIIGLLTFIRLIFAGKFKKIVITATFILAALIGIQYHNNSLDRQFSGDSLLVRFQIFESALKVLLDNPEIMVFGLGPESSTRLPDNPELLAAKTGEDSLQGAVDSAHISHIFEYGVFFIVAYHAFGLLMIVQMIKYHKNSNVFEYQKFKDLKFYLICIILFIYIVGFAQVLSLGKIALIIAQILAGGVSIFGASNAKK